MPEGQELTALADWPIHTEGVVQRLLDQTPEKLQYLHEKGIMPGTKLIIKEREPFDGLVHVAVDDDVIVLSQTTTRSILLMAPAQDELDSTKA